MSMSTFVVGFKPPDEKFKKMKAVWDACEAAGIKLPDDAVEYFERTIGKWEMPDPTGIQVDLDPSGAACLAVTRWHAESRQGFQIDLRQLDPDIKIIRFYNSW